MARRGRKLALGKKVNYTLIRSDEPAGKPMYALLRELVDKNHEELRPARIALAWHLGWKPDVDGVKKLGACRKASDLDRELARGESAWDFVVMLSSDFWTHPTVEDKQRRALLDHELCHAAPKLDPRTGDQQEDERGRKLWRLRKHDIEEFSDVVRRHGTYKRDLENFYRDLQVGVKQAELFDPKSEPAVEPTSTEIPAAERAPAASATPATTSRPPKPAAWTGKAGPRPA